MSKPKHVTGLMRKHFAAPAQEECFIAGAARLAVKRRIISPEAVNADALAQRSLTEHEIPRSLGVKVFHRDRQQTKRIGRHACFEKVEHVAGQNL